MPVRYDEPNGVAKAANTLIRWLAEAGISLAGTRALRVRGRKTGQVRTVVINVLTVGGVDYLVSPRGNTQWARNVRAAGAVEMGPGWRRRGFQATEVDDAAKPELLRRYLDNVMHAAERAKALVDRILGFSRSGLGERVPMNVQSVIEETLELLTASLPPGIRLEKRLDAGDAAVIGDATYLHQVAMNLCTNAVQAMEHGGVLSVVLERVDLSRPQVVSRGTLAPGSYVRLGVTDTGSGIPTGVLERMFDPFFTTKGVGQGTGLGLSLVHGIVTELGGAIDVTTKAGQGTCFAIWLPLTAEAGERFIAEAHELPRGNGEAVMIVDDERPLVSLAEEMLAELGYDPVGFPSSSDALQAFRADPGRFDLVLTDEAMPGLVGTDLASEIRKLGSAIPIILMSGHGGPQLEKRATAIGVSEVLHKPLQRRDLAESLARVLGAGR